MRWYIEVVFNNYFNFYGRARRKEYWTFLLIHLVISIGLYFVSKIALIAYLFITICPLVAVGIRRLHDTGKNSFWILIAGLPPLNLLYIYYMCLDSDPQTNIYGESPKRSYMDKILNDDLDQPTVSPLSSSRFDNLSLDLSSFDPEKIFGSETTVQIIILVVILISILIKSI